MNEKGGDVRLLVEDIVKVLVDLPDHVSVTPVEESDAMVLELRVAPDDLGKVIGKQGRMARSLRTIVDAASMKQSLQYELEIVEEE